MKTRASSQKIRVGFDFDGVIFYNATRNLRAYIYFVKRYLLGIRQTKFYLPKSGWTQKIAYFLHSTSSRPNRGCKQFLDLVNDPHFEVYIITARPSFMKDNIHDLLRKYDLGRLKRIIQNKKDAQPHLYKEKLIKELHLDFFVEDNWDIVKHLAQKTKAKIIWIDNLVDSMFIKYPHKSRDLVRAISLIRKPKK